MKSGNHQPRLLTAVMEAIAHLKDGKGSTQKKIIDQVQMLLTSKNVSFRNAPIHIKKALKHGVDSGLIRESGGKFKLGLDPKDYAIFKSFQKLTKNPPVREHRRRGKRRRRRSKRRRRRRRSNRSPDEHESLSGSASDKSLLETPEPTDKGRRRRKRRRRRRRGRRRNEERDSGSSSRGSSKEVTPKSSDETSKQVRKQEEQDEDMKYDDDTKDDPTCGYPQCLCNMKQDLNDGGYRNSNENFRDS